MAPPDPEPQVRMDTDPPEEPNPNQEAGPAATVDTREVPQEALIHENDPQPQAASQAATV